MNQYSRLYQDLLDVAQNHGLLVLHCVMPEKYPSLISCHEQLIKIDYSLKNTKLGSYFLSHELGHWEDYCKGKLPDICTFPFPKKNFNKTFTNLIRKIEWSATRFGKKILEDRKISTKNLPETNRKHFNSKLMPQWVAQYYKYWCRYNRVKYEKTKKHQHRTSRNRRRSRRSRC